MDSKHLKNYSQQHQHVSDLEETPFPHSHLNIKSSGDDEEEYYEEED
jgi:hypothetical protein